MNLCLDHDQTYNRRGGLLKRLICFMAGHDRKWQEMRRVGEKFLGDPYAWECRRCGSDGRLQVEFGVSTHSCSAFKDDKNSGGDHVD